MNQEKEKEILNKIFTKIKTKEPLQEGDVVFGKVVQTTDKIAIVEVEYAENKQKAISPSNNGVLFVNNISDEYIEKVGDLLRKGDIIKAEITDADTFGYKLTINADNYGVIYANCIKCKKPLNLNNNQTQIKCLNCKQTQARKIIKV
ncbi:MAG: exosome complex RNA-binding protein Csl4 [archaeon]